MVIKSWDFFILCGGYEYGENNCGGKKKWQDKSVRKLRREEKCAKNER
jgi:hypothetical protein